MNRDISIRRIMVDQGRRLVINGLLKIFWWVCDLLECEVRECELIYMTSLLLAKGDWELI